MISLRTLGELAVAVDGHSIRLPTKKQVAMLVYLAAHAGRVVQRDHLASLLWGESSPSRARHSLSQALYTIKRQLPRDCLRTNDSEVSIATSHISADFMTMQAAYSAGDYPEVARLYEGEFLEGFWVPGAPEFEQWQEAERGVLKQIAFNALSYLLVEEDRAGNWSEVDQIAARLLNIDPFAVHVHRVRIESLITSGNHVAAAEVRNRAFDLYMTEFGEVPEVLANISIPERPGATTSANLLMHNDEDGDGVRFIGRREQFLQLRAMWDSVRAGQGRFVLLSGEPGIGKTRLCNRILRLAAIQGARCFHGRCHPMERQVPYSGIVDTLSGHISADDTQALPHQWRDMLSHYIPAIVSGDGVRRPQLVQYEGRRPLLEAFVQLILCTSEKHPIVIFIDDFHWADDSTIALIDHLSRRIADAPVMLLIALRREDIAGRSELRRFVSGLSHSVGMEEVYIPEMSRHEVQELVTAYGESYSCVIPANLANRIYDRVGGRPFFIIEYLHAHRHDPAALEIWERAAPFKQNNTLPPAIRQYVTFRFLELDELETRLLSSLAVIGQAAPLEMVCRVGGVSPIKGIRGIAGLIDRGIVAENSDGLAFTHDILREAAYQWVDGPSRRVLHGRAAELISKGNKPIAGMLAHHYELAGDKRRAFENAIAAASTSGLLHGSVEAEYYLQMALANADNDVERFVVHEQLATLLYKQRRYAEAELQFAKIDAAYRNSNNVAGLLIMEVNKISAGLTSGTIPAAEGVTRLQACVREAERLQDVSTLCDILRKLGAAAHSIGDHATTLAVADELLKYIDQLTSRKEVLRNLCVSANIIGLYRSMDEGLLISGKAYEMMRTIDDPVVCIAVLRSRANNKLQAGLIAEARRDVEEAMELAGQLGTFGGLNDLMVTSAVIEMESGGYLMAEKLLTDAIKSAMERHAIRDLLVCKANLMLLELERNNIDSANELAAEILSQNRVPSVWWCGITAWAVLGDHALQRGDYSEAHRCRREVNLMLNGRIFWVLDISYVEGFLARMAVIDGDVIHVLDHLDRAIASYKQRDVFCRSRLQLHRAEVLRLIDPTMAYQQAAEVKKFGLRIGARPLVARAEALMG